MAALIALLVKSKQLLQGSTENKFDRGSMTSRTHPYNCHTTYFSLSCLRPLLGYITRGYCICFYAGIIQITADLYKESLVTKDSAYMWLALVDLCETKGFNWVYCI